MDTAADKSAMWTSLGFPAPNRKERRRSRGFKPGIWCEPSSRRARTRGTTWEESWFVPRDTLISPLHMDGSKASAIAFVPRFITAMAIVTDQERAIPPRPEGAGLPGPVIVMKTGGVSMV